jgi:hypothetical protein
MQSDSYPKAKYIIHSEKASRFEITLSPKIKTGSIFFSPGLSENAKAPVPITK